MSMSTHVQGFAPPNEEWKKMKKVYDSCEEAGLEIPDNVLKFFGYEAPDEAGVSIEIDHEEYQSDMREGIEIDLEKVPKHVKKIRFFNSY